MLREGIMVLALSSACEDGLGRGACGVGGIGGMVRRDEGMVSECVLSDVLHTRGDWIDLGHVIWVRERGRVVLSMRVWSAL